MTVFTTNEMARSLDTGHWRVRRILERSGFEPVQMVGHIRLYDQSQLRKVALALTELDERRTKVSA